jgi:2-aminoadipate transaminase
MRLNFSGVDEDQIREGVRRLGEVVREQVALYGTLTGSHPVVRQPVASPPPPPAPPEPEAELPLSNVLRLPRTRAR